MENITTEALRKSPVARYLQLASLFRGRIVSGEWAVGSRIPTVEALAEQAGVARMTIRQSLDILENEGLIERFRAKGTFVKALPKRDLWCQVRTDWSGLLMARQDAKIEVLSDTRAVEPPPHDFNVGLRPAGYRHLCRRHSRDGTAFLLANIYIAEDLCEQIPEDVYTKRTAMRLIAEIPGLKIADAHQVMTIGGADLDASTQLNIPLGEAVALVQRMAADEDGNLLLLANGVYRGDMVRVEVKLR